MLYEMNHRQVKKRAYSKEGKCNKFKISAICFLSIPLNKTEFLLLFLHCFWIVFPI